MALPRQTALGLDDFRNHPIHHRLPHHPHRKRRRISLCGCNGADVPNYNGDKITFLDPRKPGHQYFDTSPFSNEDLGVSGNSNRRFFHGPGFNNWDFALHKNTLLTERVGMEFRFEFFNAFNHAQFENPGGEINGNFGQITSARDSRIGQAALKLSF